MTDSTSMFEHKSHIVPLANIADMGHEFYSVEYDKDGLEVEVMSHKGKAISIHTLSSNRCMRCGEYLYFAYDATGNSLSVKGSPCPVDDELETVITISVPSGRMLIADSLRPVFNADKKDLDYNSAIGQSIFTQRMAEGGCAYGAVGNSSPDVYQLPDGSYKIANGAWSEQCDDLVVPSGWQKKAHISTNLWAYSIADYENWLAKGGETLEENDDYGQRTVIDVEPGVYEFTLYTGRSDFDYDGAGDGLVNVFSDFKLLEK